VVINLFNESGGFRANVGFSQWSLSIEGIPVERSDKTGTAKLFEWFLLEQKPRVLQPPKCERALAFPPEADPPTAEKNRPEREN